MRILAQGLANGELVGKAFQDYVQTVYPFMKQEKVASDKELMKRVEQEVAKGVITFAPAPTRFLGDAAKKYTMADEDVKRFRDSASRRKGLK